MIADVICSIPLEDSGHIKGLFTVVTEFFTEHQSETVLSDLSPNDFYLLLRCCLLEDVYLHLDVFKAQRSGIAMGNNAAPPLAIIYMDFIEKQILEKCHHITLWKRYIDDIFVVFDCNSDLLLNVANSINPNIQFTFEGPTEQCIPFLDSMIIQENSSFSFRLFIKDTHSGTCLPFDSFVPVNRKRNLVLSETLRADRVSSDHYKVRSINLIKNRLKDNNYPEEFINRVHTTSSAPLTDQPITFLKIPYINEHQRQRILRLSRNTGMAGKVRLIFQTEKSLAWSFRKPRVPQKCDTGCIACKTSLKPKTCFTKCVVYHITCNLCNKFYIGQTNRTIRSRILEHTKSPSSSVYKHMFNHNPHSLCNFTWKILTTITCNQTRLIAEALYINNTPNLFNDCKPTFNNLLSY